MTIDLFYRSKTHCLHPALLQVTLHRCRHVRRGCPARPLWWDGVECHEARTAGSANQQTRGVHGAKRAAEPSCSVMVLSPGRWVKGCKLRLKKHICMNFRNRQ